jgi:hypothetical protein
MSEPTQVAGVDPRWVRWAWVYGLIVAAGLAHFLFGIPIQYSDSFGNLLTLSTSWPELLAAQFSQRAFLRPGLWAALKAVHDLSGGEYTVWFRAVHAVQTGLLIVLYLKLIQPRTRWDAVLVPFGLAVLLGLHTFWGTVREAYPINTFLTIVLLCLAAAALSLARYRWWNDLLALACFAAAALTLESGLLVFVILVAGALAGARGVSRGGVALVALACVGYFILRFPILEVGSPGLMERASGFGFSVLEPTDLAARFGDSPIGFYAYNVAASIGSVLFSEPNSGLFELTRQWVESEVEPARVVNLLSSLAATGVLAMYAMPAYRRWRAGQRTRDDQLFAMAVAVVAANAAISYPYTKDVVMSPAGAFYAAAAFVAARSLIRRLAEGLPLSTLQGRPEGRPLLMSKNWRMVAVGALMLVLGTCWALRFVGLHLHLRAEAHAARNEWAYRDNEVRRGDLELDGRSLELFRHLQRDAIYRYPAPPPLDVPLARWMVPE